MHIYIYSVYIEVLRGFSLYHYTIPSQYFNGGNNFAVSVSADMTCFTRLFVLHPSSVLEDNQGTSKNSWAEYPIRWGSCCSARVFRVSFKHVFQLYIFTIIRNVCGEVVLTDVKTLT